MDPLSSLSGGEQLTTMWQPLPDLPSTDPAVQFFGSTMPLPRRKPQLSKMSRTIRSLQFLLRLEFWAAALELTEDLPANYGHSLRISICRVICFFKLGKYREAETELGAFGGRLLTSNEPTIPFTMRLLYARLPHHLKDSGLAITRLHTLIEWCKDGITTAAAATAATPPATLSASSNLPAPPVLSPANPTTSTTSPAFAPVPASPVPAATTPITDPLGTDPLGSFGPEWLGEIGMRPAPAAMMAATVAAPSGGGGTARGSGKPPGVLYPEEDEFQLESLQPPTLAQRRRDLLRTYVVLGGLLAERQDYLGAVRVLADALPLFARPEHSLRRAILVGHLEGARAALAHIEHLKGPTSPLTAMMKGFMALPAKLHKDALQCFEAVLASEPTSVAAANNAATCEVALGDISAAIARLEGCIRKDPYHTLCPTLLENLAFLYDLTGDRADERKAVLVRLVELFGPEHYVLPPSLASIPPLSMITATKAANATFAAGMGTSV